MLQVAQSRFKSIYSVLRSSIHSENTEWVIQHPSSGNPPPSLHHSATQKPNTFFKNFQSKPIFKTPNIIWQSCLKVGLHLKLILSFSQCSFSLQIIQPFQQLTRKWGIVLNFLPSSFWLSAPPPWFSRLPVISPPVPSPPFCLALNPVACRPCGTESLILLPEGIFTSSQCHGVLPWSFLSGDSLDGIPQEKKLFLEIFF